MYLKVFNKNLHYFIESSRAMDLLGMLCTLFFSDKKTVEETPPVLAKCFILSMFQCFVQFCQDTVPCFDTTPVPDLLIVSNKI